ncbi:GMC family oxidoreductase N-terminal domain-containing protein [Mesorhizobium sp. LHD-90]|uniref:GMC family oxidoreductase n=1 Tax=Mesorhizobium sp. LHD-90 TaxID=3071414 RepID=UPI0027DFCCDB|nr:GMC family oxidoreductase N-terminal domain-containing protein [Mesorhizobium sp. LHD-90]MDQ6437496.1 GMC family oxidoreductase N-terminal domain-containing protein [Mesorhizobium sp. LHD-90]
MQTYDYIVAGAGSAGCTIANRLVNAGKRVLLIEAGPRDNDKFIHMPATFARVLRTNRSWIYQSEPEAAVGGRRLPVPQGRTLGGGSSVNAMLYIRGQREDYDGWRDLGCPGWSWDDVLPAYKRLERNERLAGAWHGSEGPLPVSDARYRHPLSLAYVRAAQQAGYRYNDDFNGERQEGVGFYQTTTLGGVRQSAATVFLKPLAGNPNLTVVTDAHVGAVTLENGSAAGLSYTTADGRTVQASAKEEVILAAGALATPKIMMLSGLGPAVHLASLGIPVIRDMPGVGRDLQDHVATPVYAATRDPISLLGQDRGLQALRHGLEYVLFRSGLLASNVVESGGFFDTDSDGRPDIQFHVLPVMIENAVHGSVEQHGMELNPCVLRPKSRGKVELRSRDPKDPIRFTTGFLSEPEDLNLLVEGVKVARRILRQPALRAVVKEELAPGGSADLPDDKIVEHIMKTAKTVYHPCGTSRMGSNEAAVVDPQLRVRGVPRLRICDASIMPRLTSGNTNAPTIMIADRCADFVLGR